MGKDRAVIHSEALLWPLLDKEAELRREYRIRNKKFDQKRVLSDEIAQHLSEGWVIHKKVKGKALVRREKALGERLENLWWVLLYKMGYRELNSGTNFRIRFKRKRLESLEKHIDVFASDDETVIVTICCANERLQKKSMKSALEELASVKGEIAASIKAFYGKNFKPKILWFVVTENIMWSPDDVRLAEKECIRRVTEMELPYYTQLAEHLGHAARFQFLAEFLKDQTIPELADVKVSATRAKLGGRYFYSFVSTPRQLLKIAFVNHRTLDDPEGHPTYQRLIQKSRLKAISQYIETGGFFPNNLLINFVKPPRFDIIQKDVSTEVHFGNLYLPNKYKSAWIIDGQHRLYGYASLPDIYLDQKLVVIAFEGISKQEEANLFVTINHEQKSVPKNLLDDLEGQLKWGSDNPGERIGALAARIIQQMNKDLSSPLYGRFSAEGIKVTQRACLTIPQVKLGLKRSGLIGTASKSGFSPGPLSSSTDNATLQRAQKILNGYFRQIQEADIARWELGRQGKICTNESIQALSLLLAEIINYRFRDEPAKRTKLSDTELLEEIGGVIAPLLDFLKGSATEIDSFLTVVFGSGGPRELLLRYSKILRKSFPDFSPEGYGDWEQAQSEELKQTADQQVQQINLLVLEHVFKVFRMRYGEERNAYWEKGVLKKEIKTSAYSKSQEADIDTRLPIEAYLDFIDLKTIVEHKDRWHLFKDVLDIPVDGEKGIAKNLGWMNRFNEIRRIPAHAAPGRNYTVDDFALLELLFSTLKARIEEYDYDKIEPSDD